VEDEKHIKQKPKGDKVCKKDVYKRWTVTYKRLEMEQVKRPHC